MGKTAKKIPDAVPPTDAPVPPEAKETLTTRTPEQQALIDKSKEALAQHDASQAAAGNPPGVAAPSSLEALKAATLGRDPGTVDAPARAPAANPRNAHIVHGGDKVDNQAERFHQQMDEEQVDVEDTMSRRARAYSGQPVSEEDRRRAILDTAQGVDTFPREAGQTRPNEPTLQQCNAQYFAETDVEMARKAEMQEKVGDALHQAFGAQGGRRILKNLR